MQLCGLGLGHKNRRNEHKLLHFVGLWSYFKIQNCQLWTYTTSFSSVKTWTLSQLLWSVHNAGYTLRTRGNIGREKKGERKRKPCSLTPISTCCLPTATLSTSLPTWGRQGQSNCSSGSGLFHTFSYWRRACDADLLNAHGHHMFDPIRTRLVPQVNLMTPLWNCTVVIHAMGLRKCQIVSVLPFSPSDLLRLVRLLVWCNLGINISMVPSLTETPKPSWGDQEQRQELRSCFTVGLRKYNEALSKVIIPLNTLFNII